MKKSRSKYYYFIRNLKADILHPDLIVLVYPKGSKIGAWVYPDRINMSQLGVDFFLTFPDGWTQVSRVPPPVSKRIKAYFAEIENETRG